MPEIELRHDRRRLFVDVAILSAENPSDLTYITACALVDTGATVSGIGPRVIRDAGLRSYTKKRLKSATNEAFVDYYLFRIGLFSSQNASQETNAIPFIFDDSDGFCWGQDADFEVVLGMDVISKCDLKVLRMGKATLSFG